MATTIGNRIEIARKRLNLTRDRVAEPLGITGQAVYDWERNGKSPDPEKLPQLRKTLKVTYAWLLAGGDSEPPPPDDTRVLLDDISPTQAPMTIQMPAKRRASKRR